MRFDGCACACVFIYDVALCVFITRCYGLIPLFAVFVQVSLTSSMRQVYDSVLFVPDALWKLATYQLPNLPDSFEVCLNGFAID